MTIRHYVCIMHVVRDELRQCTVCPMHQDDDEFSQHYTPLLNLCVIVAAYYVH